MSKNAYASRDAIFDDLAMAYQNAIKAFYAAGCRYLQFDDTAWAYLCSQEEMKKARERGLDVDHLQETYAKCINKALEAKPADMTITTHVCRGNFRSTFISSGGYEPVAETLLAKCNYDGYFLEYDTDRAGGFEPLRFLPKGNKIVVLGLDHLQAGPAGAARRTSRSASRRRPNLSRSINFACRRNAASPPPKKATCWPRTSNGPSCAWWWNWPTKFGASKFPSSPRGGA